VNKEYTNQTKTFLNLHLILYKSQQGIDKGYKFQIIHMAVVTNYELSDIEHGWKVDVMCLIMKFNRSCCDIYIYIYIYIVIHDKLPWYSMAHPWIQSGSVKYINIVELFN
jgi:hypothetical protein